MKQDTYTNVSVKTKDGVAEIQAEIPVEVFSTYRDKAFDAARKALELPGFRKGHVPEDMARKHIDEAAVLEEAAYQALQNIYPELIKSQEFEVMSSPEVQITKLAPNNPLGFQIKVGITPAIKLPDYKKIAQEVFSTPITAEVTDEDVKKTTDEILAMHTEGDAKQELTDEFVKTLGKFSSVADFKEKLKENIQYEKQRAEYMKRRDELATKLADATSLSIPDITINSELNILMKRIHEDLEKQKLTLEEYLKRVNSTEKDWMQKQRDAIERQLKARLILKAIAKKEEITPKEDQVTQQAVHMQHHYGDIDIEQLKDYVRTMMTNDLIVQYLESLSNIKNAKA